MGIVIKIRLRKEDGRKPAESIVAKAIVTVARNGAPIAASRKSSAFERIAEDPGAALAAGDTVAIGITIPDVLEVLQSWRISAVAGTRRAAPTFALSPVATPEWGALHPRLVSPNTTAAGASLVFTVAVDTTFLRVTQAPSVKAHVGTSMSGCAPARVEIYEHTVRSTVAAWIAVFPTKVPDTATAGKVWVNFRPEALEAGDGYVNCDHFPIGRFTRYSDKPATPGHFVSGGSWNPFELCGWADQLEQSGKPVILLYPVINVLEFGALLGGALTASGGLLEQWLRALWADRVLAKGKGSAPALDRLALSGFSLGGDRCLDAFAANQGKVDELYLFDPGKGIPASVVSWVKAKPADHKLRMIGVRYSESAAMQLAAQLATVTSDWTAKPNKADYWYTDAVYLRSLNSSGSGAPLDPDTGTGTPTATTAASKASHMFLVSETFGRSSVPLPVTTTLSFHHTGQGGRPVVEKAAVTGIGAHEAGSFLQFHLTGTFNGGNPARTKAEFDKLVHELTHNDFGKGAEQPRISCTRHQWAVIGGEDAGGVFKGYLRLCLEGSKF